MADFGQPIRLQAGEFNTGGCLEWQLPQDPREELLFFFDLLKVFDSIIRICWNINLYTFGLYTFGLWVIWANKT